MGGEVYDDLPRAYLALRHGGEVLITPRLAAEIRADSWYQIGEAFLARWLREAGFSHDTAPPALCRPATPAPAPVDRGHVAAALAPLVRAASTHREPGAVDTVKAAYWLYPDRMPKPIRDEVNAAGRKQQAAEQAEARGPVSWEAIVAMYQRMMP